MRHFRKEPRSTEMVEVPRDVWDFIVESLEAHGNLDGGEIPVVVVALELATTLAKEIEVPHQ